MSSAERKNLIRALSKGKTVEQHNVIRYFLADGCMGRLGCIKDDAYEQLLMSTLNQLNFKQRALDKIGLDEDQLKEIPPVSLHGYNFADDDALVRVGADNRIRSSKYDTSWLFFSDTQVYIYYYKLDMASINKHEETNEYFYKDITNFSTATQTTEAICPSGCGGREVIKVPREYSNFALIVPGDKFSCGTSGVAVADLERSVSAMKQKLREKKQQ